jgi:signal transduction histidine kinase
MAKPPEALPAGSLAALLKVRRQELIDRWTSAVMRENSPEPLPRAALVDEMPRFIDDLLAALHPEAMPLPSTPQNALEHGSQRLQLGFNVREVVREYGILHRCIIQIANEAGLAITPREQSILATDLTDGIAAAVSQYVSERDGELRRQMSEHLGFIAHEVRNPLSSARMALGLLQRRELAGGGRVVDLLARTLKRTSEVIDNALNHATLSLGAEPRLEPLRVATVLNELVVDYAAEAEGKGIEIVVSVPQELVLEGDRRLLHSAISNLLQNALKFSRPSSTIYVRGQSAEPGVAIEVEDACGGLPPGRAEELFMPLVRRGTDKTGFGLGLAIAQQAAEAHGGTLRVRDLPGQGCVFKLELPATAARRR